MIIGTVLLAGQNYLHFLLRDPEASLAMGAVETVIVVGGYIGVACSVKAGSREVICLTFLVDKMFIAMCGG